MNFKVWILVLLLAPLVYVLTLPPVLILLAPGPPMYSHEENVVIIPFSDSESHWTDWYSKPYRWLRHHSPVGDRIGRPIDKYFVWWIQRLGRPDDQAAGHGDRIERQRFADRSLIL